MYHAMVALVSFVLMVGTYHPPSSRLRVLLDPGFNPILRSIMACTLVTSTVKTLWEKGLLGRTGSCHDPPILGIHPTLLIVRCFGPWLVGIMSSL